MKNILKSMQDLYAAKLVSWQLEGRKEIEYCYKVINFVESYKEILNNTNAYYQSNALMRYYHFDITSVPKDEEILNWCIGYLRSLNYCCKVYDKKYKFKNDTDFKIIKTLCIIKRIKGE